jgi:hypothetical protein
MRRTSQTQLRYGLIFIVAIFVVVVMAVALAVVVVVAVFVVLIVAVAQPSQLQIVRHFTVQPPSPSATMQQVSSIIPSTMRSTTTVTCIATSMTTGRTKPDDIY